MVKAFLGSLLLITASALAQDRPNFVWIVSEDNSLHYLRHFFPGGAKTPAIEALAAQGLSFDHAFSNAPVCSVARTTLITGCHAPRLGTQFHRRQVEAHLPDGLRLFPAYLRAAGYHTTNNSKKDYNALEGEGVWDASSAQANWRDRPDPSQPFFHFASHNESHESSLHFDEASFQSYQPQHDPASVPLAPHHPDTPLFRHVHARYLDRIQVIDGIVAETVQQLQADGLLESTFIFYFGDHGGVLPRGKGYLYDNGLHVPLVVRVPAKFRHLVEGFPIGGRVPGFVSFIDFGPTLLNLAGLPALEDVDGRAFLGPGVALSEVNARDEAFGYADRMDEKYDFVRSLRKGRFHYIRCFQPWLPDGLQNNYRYINLAFQEWRSLSEKGQLQGPARAFFEPRPVEMLFDCESDPFNTRNLAADPAHAETLKEVRRQLGSHLRVLPDLSFYPESHLIDAALPDAAAFGQSQQTEIQTLADIADTTLMPFEEARPRLEVLLDSGNPWQRYWAVMACTAFGEQAARLAPLVQPLLKDAQPAVRFRAIEFLGRLGQLSPQPALAELVNTTTNPVFAAEVLNSVVWFRDHFSGKYPAPRESFMPQVENDAVTRRLNYLAGNPYPSEAPKKRKKKTP